MMNDDRCSSSLSSSPLKMRKYSSSPLQRSQSLYLDEEDKKDSRIQELEEALEEAKQSRKEERENAEEASRKQREEKEEAERRMKEMEEAMKMLREKLALCEDIPVIDEENNDGLIEMD